MANTRSRAETASQNTWMDTSFEVIKNEVGTIADLVSLIEALGMFERRLQILLRRAEANLASCRRANGALDAERRAA